MPRASAPKPNHLAAGGRLTPPLRLDHIGEKILKNMNRGPNSDIQAAFNHLRNSKLSEEIKCRTLYVLPKQLDYEFGQNKERALQKIADHMLEFVGPIDRAFLTLDMRTSQIKAQDKVFVVAPDGQAAEHKKEISNQIKDKAGEYRIFNNGFKEIVIVFNSKLYLEHYLAILAHEMAHHVLSENKISPPTTLDNEIFTDLAAIYLGFGILLCKGYEGGAAFDGGIGYIDRSTVYSATASWFALNQGSVAGIFDNFHFIQPERYELLFGVLWRKLFAFGHVS